MYGEGICAETLHALVEEGVIESKVVHRCARCPNCSSHQCVIDERCAACDCANLKTIPLFHHVPCAGIFEAPDDVALIEQCPKCHGAIATDDELVDRVGETYLCLECQGRSPEPQLRFMCLGCHVSHAFADVTFHRLWAFKRRTCIAESSNRLQAGRDG